MHLRYLTFFFAITFLWVAVIVGINFVVDPASIYKVVDREGFNKIKPKISKYRFIWKSAYIEKNKPEIVFLGNSRIEIGIDPDSMQRLGLAAKDQSIFNSATPGANVYGIKRFAQQAILVGDAKELFIGVDYVQFRASDKRGTERNYIEHEGVFSVDAQGRSQPFHRWVVYSKTLFSADAFSASMQTLSKQKAKYLSYTELGHNTDAGMVKSILSRGPQRGYFLREEGQFIDQHMKSKSNALSFDSGIEQLREILLLAKKHNVKTTLFITPTHVHLQYLDAHAGDGTNYDNWKRALVDLVSEINEGAQQPTVLWDFSIPVAETEESPPEGEEFMRWYLDPSHFRREMGDRMLLRMLGNSQDEEFGLQLTTETIELAIQKHEQSLLLWQETHPDDYAAFMERIDKRRIDKRRELRRYRKSKSTRVKKPSKAKGV